MHVAVAGDYPGSEKSVSGGVEAVVLYLTQELIKVPDLRVSVVTLDRNARQARRRESGCLTVYYLPASQLPSRFYGWQNVKKIRDQLLSLEPDIIHAHAANEYALAAAGSGIPWILTLHGIRHLEAGLLPGAMNRYREWFVRKDEDRVVRAADHIILISPYVGETFSEQIHGQTFHIDNPVSEGFYEISPAPEPGRILFVGRLIPTKDVLTLLKAVDLLRLKLPDISLVLAGKTDGVDELSGRYFGRLKDFIGRADLGPLVTFLGQLEESSLRNEYARSSVVVSSSVVETSPMAVMQAMAAAVPVVSTDTGGARHLVEDGVTGFLVPVGDSAAMADALQKVLVDNSVAAGMGVRARAIADSRFRAKLVAERTSDVYREIVTGSKERNLSTA